MNKPKNPRLKNSKHCCGSMNYISWSSRAEASRAICAALMPPPTVALCLISSSGGSGGGSWDDNVRHHHRYAAALHELMATGAAVEPIFAADRSECDASAMQFARRKNVTIDVALEVHPGQVWMVDQLWPYCFYRFAQPGFALGTRAPERHHGRACGKAIRDSSSGGGYKAQRLAIGLAGLARTFSHPLVYKAMRGNLVDSLAASPFPAADSSSASTVVRIFAALRLDDDRPVTGGGGPGMGATMRKASTAEVWRALRWLGADPRDVTIRKDATIAVPKCGTPDANRLAGPQPPTRPMPCVSYTSACAVPTVAGQIWSRARIYDLVVAHELREGERFDSVLFIRPDLAFVVPFQPHCTYPFNAARYQGDWLVWLPRVALDGAFKRMSDDFQSCRIRFEGQMAALGPEGFLLMGAARHGVNMSRVDEATHVMAIVRPPGKDSPPAGFVCSQLDRMLKQAAIATKQTNLSAVSPRGGFVGFSYRGKGAERGFRRDVPTCTRLLVSNPANSRVPAEDDALATTAVSTRGRDAGALIGEAFNDGRRLATGLEKLRMVRGASNGGRRLTTGLEAPWDRADGGAPVAFRTAASGPRPRISLASGLHGVTVPGFPCIRWHSRMSMLYILQLIKGGEQECRKFRGRCYIQVPKYAPHVINVPSALSPSLAPSCPANLQIGSTPRPFTSGLLLHSAGKAGRAPPL